MKESDFNEPTEHRWTCPVCGNTVRVRIQTREKEIARPEIIRAQRRHMESHGLLELLWDQFKQKVLPP